MAGFKFAKIAWHDPLVLQLGFTNLMVQMFAFLNEANEAETPLMTKWVCDIKGGKTDELLSIWAAKGELTPLKRIEQLIDEREDLKAQIERLKRFNTSNPI